MNGAGGSTGRGYEGVARATPWLLVATALGFYLRMFDNPGTADVTDVLPQWMASVRAQGAIETFRTVEPDYPPLAFTSFYAITRAADWLGATDFRMLKAVILASTLAGVGVYGYWSRSLSRSSAFLWTLLVSSACLGYLDVFYLWSLLLAIVALQRRHLATAGCLLALAVGTKWQPLLVAPFFVLEACHPGGATAALRQLPAWRHLGRFMAGMSTIVVLEGTIFGFQAIATSFERAIDRSELTAQALNVNWIVHILLVGGINTPDTNLAATIAAWTARTGFAAAYLFLLVGFWRNRETFSDFLWYAASGAAVYFTFNTGVHENHLFPTLVMAFALWVTDPVAGAPMALYYGVSSNVNLLAFYGLDGRPAYYTPLFNEATVMMALANTSFVMLLLSSAGARWRRARSEPS